jgi:hypothetical protein
VQCPPKSHGILRILPTGEGDKMLCIKPETQTHFTGYNVTGCRCDKCRKANADYNRAYRAANKERLRELAYIRRQSVRDVLSSIKVERGCKVCGYNKSPEALDFHHRDPKTKRFHISQKLGCNLDRVLGEVEKCDVICANCHRILTHREMLSESSYSGKGDSPRQEAGNHQVQDLRKPDLQLQ